MTAVIKHGIVASSSLSVGSMAPKPDPALLALAAERDAAVAEAASLRATLADVERKARRDRETAHVSGVEEGRRAIQDRDDGRLTALIRAIDEAREAWDERLASLEPLAATLARNAVAKVFASHDVGEMVADTVARHVAALRESGATTVRVHPALIDGVRSTGLRIVADPDLPHEGCRVELSLGEADLSIDRQWNAIDTFLASIEAPR